MKPKKLRQLSHNIKNMRATKIKLWNFSTPEMRSFHMSWMAQTELQKLSEEVESSYEISRLYCVHRIGLVPGGEASLQVIIWSPHRVAGLEAIYVFIAQLKQDVPIWKEVVFADGRRVVVEYCH